MPFVLDNILLNYAGKMHFTVKSDNMRRLKSNPIAITTVKIQYLFRLKV